MFKHHPLLRYCQYFSHMHCSLKTIKKKNKYSNHLIKSVFFFVLDKSVSKWGFFTLQSIIFSPEKCLFCITKTFLYLCISVGFVFRTTYWVARTYLYRLLIKSILMDSFVSYLQQILRFEPLCENKCFPFPLSLNLS